MNIRITSYFITSIFVILCSSICASTVRNDTTAPWNVGRSKPNENRMSTIMTKSNKNLVSYNNKVLAKSPEFLSPRKWVTQVFMEAAEKFDMDSNVTAKCKKDFDLYKMYLQNQTLWAVRSEYLIVLCLYYDRFYLSLMRDSM